MAEVEWGVATGVIRCQRYMSVGQVDTMSNIAVARTIAGRRNWFRVISHCKVYDNLVMRKASTVVTASLYWQWSQNSKNMRESLYTSLMTIAGSGSCSYGTANVAHLLIVKLMGHSIYYFEALLPQCLVQQLPIYNCTTFTCHNHN